jgi:transglutaminase-like putative cysteine protease
MRLGWCATSLLLLLTAGAAPKPRPVSADDARPWLKLGERQTISVQMKTTLTVPANLRVTSLRVWHALPTPRPWSSGVPERPGATDITFGRIGGAGVQEYDVPNLSHHIKWELSEARDVVAGRPIEFVSEFKVTTADRSVVPSLLKGKWSDYPPKKADAKRSVVNPQLTKLAASIKKRNGPAATVYEFCRWIGTSMKYDASVPYPPSDIAAILKTGRGHCGHYYCLLEQLCIASDIPIRTVWGLNLYAPDGHTNGLQAVRADFTNIHTWAEVDIPGCGWIEVEPSLGAKAFDIPARYIQNNPWFQNYAVWYESGGVWAQPRWDRSGDGWVSPFKLSNEITYK